jgi:hypothetical protein
MRADARAVPGNGSGAALGGSLWRRHDDHSTITVDARELILERHLERPDHHPTRGPPRQHRDQYVDVVLAPNSAGTTFDTTLVINTRISR